MTSSQCEPYPKQKSTITSFHTTIKFTHEMSSEEIVFLDTDVFKDPMFITDKILDVETHFKPTETFQ